MIARQILPITKYHSVLDIHSKTNDQEQRVEHPLFFYVDNFCQRQKNDMR